MLKQTSRHRTAFAEARVNLSPCIEPGASARANIKRQVPSRLFRFIFCLDHYFVDMEFDSPLFQPLLAPPGGKAADKPDAIKESELECIANDFNERMSRNLLRELPEVNNLNDKLVKTAY